MKRMYVRFAGDNDFFCTVEAFMRALAPRVLVDGGWEKITKEQVAELFNAHAFSIYALHQCRELVPEAHLRDYLMIGPKDVYFDSEIDDFDNHNNDGCLAALNHDNSIFYCVM